jgi:hypothetical protein
MLDLLDLVNARFIPITSILHQPAAARSMAPSRRSLSAILLVAVMAAAAAAWMHAADACNQHLSGNYKGACWSWFDDDHCASVCWDENTDNIHGYCAFFQCWCATRCAADETVAAASAPVPV